ncbi:glycosyltransferase [Thermodesulfobacteriota bacterium]
MNSENLNPVILKPKNKHINRLSSGLELNAERRQEQVVCIISPNKDVYSETFIRAHIERLPAKVRVLYGGYFPRFQDNGRELLPISVLPLQIIRGIWRRLLRLPGDCFEKAALKRFLRANNVAAVLAEYGPAGTAVMGVCKETRIPLIVYFRGYDVYSHRVIEKEGQNYTKLFENAAAIFAVSRDIEIRLLHLGAPQQKLHYNPSGVDTALFQGADPAQAPPLFLSVGRFVDKKAPHLTILTFSKVFESIPEARLIMIGEGPLWESCKHLTKALGIESAVEFLGLRSHIEVAVIMRGARALIQHSIRTNCGDTEGTPNTIKEAGSSGLPVVATQHGGIPDIVIDRETGFLVEEGDIESMALHMIQLAKNPGLAARLGKAAREHVCSNFSMDQSVDRLWGVIEDAIQKVKKLTG